MDTKNALLDSAETAVRASGFDGFSYADLAEDVGIRKASIHYHFPKKADLGLALMERYNEEMVTQLAAIDAASQTAGDQLSGQIKRYRDALSGGSQLCLCVALSVSPDNLNEDLIRQLSAFRKASVDWLTKVFKAAKEDGSITNVKNPKDEAFACLALLEGAHLTARVSSDMAVFDNTVAQLSERILAA